MSHHRGPLTAFRLRLKADHMIDSKTKPKENRLALVAETILIAAGMVVLLMSPHSIDGDGIERFDAVTDLVQNGRLSTTRYSMVGPLFSSVLYVLGSLFRSPQWWCSRYNFVILVLGLFLLYRMLSDRADGPFLRKFILVLMLASMFPHHQMTYYGDLFTAVFVALGILAVNHGKSLVGWAAIILGVANTPASIVGLGMVVLLAVLKNRKLRYVAALIVCVALIIGESWIRQGAPLFTVASYEGSAGFRTALPYSGLAGFSYPILFGLISILFSFGKGIFWFCPGLLLPVRKDLPGMTVSLHETYRSWVFFLIGLILVYSKWWAWYGGWFWGPRFFLFASVPASFTIAVYLSHSRRSTLSSLWLLAVLLWSFWVGANGLIFGQENLEICVSDNHALEAFCWYVPEFSVLFRPFVVAAPLGTKAILAGVFYIAVSIYLAIPLILHILRNTFQTARLVKNGRLDIGEWHL